MSKKYDKNKTTRCCYCDNKAETKDHVPPKGFFSKEEKMMDGINLITVPSCKICNNLNSNNDVAFKLINLWYNKHRQTSCDKLEEIISRSLSHGKEWDAIFKNINVYPIPIWFKR